MSALTYVAGETSFQKVTNEMWYQGEVQVLPFEQESILDDIYTTKAYCAYLEWEYTDERAQQIIDYITAYLQSVEEIELWKIWLGGAWEGRDREARPNMKSSRTRDEEDWADWDEWKQHKVENRNLSLHQLDGQILREFFATDYSRQRCLVIHR